MDNEASINPWITVSKKKRNRTPVQNETTPLRLAKSDFEALQTNNFHGLSLDDDSSDEAASNGKETHPHPLSSPGIQSPPRKKSRKDPNKKSHYPVIKVNANAINKQVGLTDFRDLILWMLDDTSSPDWVEVRNKSYVRNCVVLLVPGLGPETFNIDPTRGSEGKRMRRFDEVKSSCLSHVAEVFKYLWLPRAPGTNTQLYSPVAAFLNCPLSHSQNLQRAREQSKRNSIELDALLMNPAEMRSAGYPIHPLHEDGFADPDVVCTPYQTETSGRRKTVIGLDCEMCKTEQGSEITRVTLVDFQGNTLYDQLVKPENPIIDYLTTWSGITEERLLNTTTTLAMVQAALIQIIDSDTILVGHSLECDLQALKIAHPHVIDTSIIYQHSRGPPYKPSLKWLAQKWLKRKIQSDLAGHDSAEDAVTCIDLVKLKCKRGRDFGLFNVDSESIFSRLKRRGVDSAVVEYGTRGGNFYGDKVRTCISVESDSEVVDGILESLQTGHQFVWSRMKDIENAAGWRDGDSLEKTDMADTLTGFDSNIQRLWDGLPSCTALMVISGSGDPREMSRLYAKKRTYDEELKHKKWDDINIKWMDADQQAFTLSVDKARTGVGFVAIK